MLFQLWLANFITSSLAINLYQDVGTNTELSCCKTTIWTGGSETLWTSNSRVNAGGFELQTSIAGMYERDVSREVRKSRGAGAETTNNHRCGYSVHGPCTFEFVNHSNLSKWLHCWVEIWHMHDGDCYPVSIFYGCADRRHKRAFFSRVCRWPVARSL